MKLYVINLDRSASRLHRIENLFQQQGLQFVRIKAIDAQEISNECYEQAMNESSWSYPITRGEAACFFSHRFTLQKIAEGTDSHGVVFEDDVEISQHAHIFLKNSDWIPHDADIVKLDSQEKKVLLGSPSSMGDNFYLSRLKSEHILAAAYIVSKQAAAFLVERMARFSVPVDHFLFNFNEGIASRLRIYQFDPAIVVQGGLPSTLEYERRKNINWKRQKNRNSMSFLRKAVREILRVCGQFIFLLAVLRVKFFTEDRWKRVLFDKTK